MSTTFMTTREASAYLTRQGLTVSPGTLNRWRSTGDGQGHDKGPAFLKQGARVYYTSEELDRWVKHSLRRQTHTLPQGEKGSVGPAVPFIITIIICTLTAGFALTSIAASSMLHGVGTVYGDVSAWVLASGIVWAILTLNLLCVGVLACIACQDKVMQEDAQSQLSLTHDRNQKGAQ